METAFIVYFVGVVMSTLHVYYHIHRHAFDGESMMISLFVGCGSWAYVLWVIVDWYLSIKK